MRFIANGPAIPSELLTARDAGRVLFFCGAGVSRAAARLPDFIDLAGDVLDLLGSTSGSEARLLHAAAKAARDDLKGVGGPGIDRVFSMLEQEFDLADIRHAVARALKPKGEPDLAYHRALLDLSRVRSGDTRLVTTNFDQLFEACDERLRTWTPPHLPDPKLPVDFRGIVHLHGSVDREYTHIVGETLVVSTAEFGYSYLAEGWATRFIQALMRRFTVVFVGYSADDPPIQYLLEAVRRFDGFENPTYAFHAGSADKAEAQWAHKGVTPIAYDPADGHIALWDTLQAWAKRAHDPIVWFGDVIRMALRGPAVLQPHERGMVCDLVSSSDGAHVLVSSGDVLLPASWLMVFDREERRRKPAYAADRASAQAAWEQFGLDSEPFPAEADAAADDRRIFPFAPWDAFTLTSLDQREAAGLARALVVKRADHPKQLVPPRIEFLRDWLVGTANQPTTLWWAAGQHKLDATLVERITGVMATFPDRYSPAMRRQWRWLFRAWEQRESSPDARVFQLERLACDGWTADLIRAAAQVFSPRLTVERADRAAKPDDLDDNARIVSTGVEYPIPHRLPDIPSQWLGEMVPRLRRHIEDGLTLSRDLGLPTTTRSYDLLNHDPHAHRSGLSALLPIFCDWMLKWVAIDPMAAREEATRWAANREGPFPTLTIWAASVVGLTDEKDLATLLRSMNDTMFWNHYCEGDLLRMLVLRWADLEQADRAAIEDRILNSRVPVLQEHPGAAKLIAWNRLHRWYVLKGQGVAFTRDAKQEMAALQRLAPDFSQTDPSEDPLDGRGIRFFADDIDSSQLEALSVQDIIASMNDDEDLDFRHHVHRRPFLGLVQRRPVLAIRALGAGTKQGRFHARSWRTLMSPQSNVAWTPRLVAIATRRLAQLTTTNLAEIAHDVARWQDSHAVVLYTRDRDGFHLLWTALLVAAPYAEAVVWENGYTRDWTTEAINSPVQGLLSAIIQVVSEPEGDDGALPAMARSRFDALLSLPGDLHRYAVCLLARQFSWLCRIDRQHTLSVLLPYAHQCDDRAPFFDGFFSGRLHLEPESFKALKADLLSAAVEGILQSDEERVLASLLMDAWIGVDIDGRTVKLVEDHEFRDALVLGGDRLRVTVLWLLSIQGNEAANRWRDALDVFFARIWPRQRIARTGSTPGALIRLSLQLTGMFDRIVPMILPHLVRLQEAGAYWYLTEADAELAEAHPVALLELLSMVLPVYTRDWPIGMEPLIRTLAAQPATANDPQLADLIRRLHQR